MKGRNKALLCALLAVSTSMAKHRISIEAPVNNKTEYSVEDTGTIHTFYADEIARNVLSVHRNNMNNYKHNNKVVLVGATVKEKIANYLKAQGYNDAAVCGFLACVEFSTHYNPKAVGDCGRSIGIIQWHDEQKEMLIEYCKEHGYPVDGLEGQLEFLMYQMQSEEKFHKALEEYLRSMENDEEHAYWAAYRITCYILNPEETLAKADGRGWLAKKMFRELDNSKTR